MSYLTRKSAGLTTPHPMNVGIQPALWLDAFDPDTLTFNVSDISQEDDKSGNGKDAAQSVAVEQPLFVSNGLNSRPTIRNVHAGTALGLEISGGINIALNAPRTMFMVINPTAGFGNSEFFGKDTGNMIDFGTFRPPSNFNFPNRIRFRHADKGPGFDVTSASGTVPYGTPTIITVIDGPVSGLNAWNMNTNIFSVSTPRAFSWELNVNLGIGKSLDVGARSYHGDQSEIVIFPGEFSTENRLRILAYLTAKWGF